MQPVTDCSSSHAIFSPKTDERGGLSYISVSCLGTCALMPTLIMLSTRLDHILRQANTS